MKKPSIDRYQLTTYLENYLEPSHFKDYCPNGLQVQGKNTIKKIVGGVTASKDLIEQAILAKADAILVHHGWFWKNDDAPITGQLYHRLKLLMDHQINLYAYHLPLDQHSVVGNNAQLAKHLGLLVEGQHPSNPMIWYGTLQKKRITLSKFGRDIQQQLDRQPLIIGELDQVIQKVAWCTGGAQNYFSQAIELGIEVYLSGEISEPTYHLAKESGVAYIAAGHHATERYGVKALGEHLQEKLGITYQFIDIPNPV